MAVGPDGGGGQSQEAQPHAAEQHVNRADAELVAPQGAPPEPRLGVRVNPEEEEEAELSVAVGLAEGQMENILQEATKEEVATETPKEESDTQERVVSAGDAAALEAGLCAQVNGTEVQGGAGTTGAPPENGLTLPHEFESHHLFVQKVEELNHLVGALLQPPGELLKRSSEEEELTRGLPRTDSCVSESSPHRTLTNGFLDSPPEEACSHAAAQRGLSKRPSLMESSTETLTEEASRGPEAPPAHPHRSPAAGPDGSTQSLISPGEAGDQGSTRTVNGGSKRPSVGAFQPPSADLCRDGLWNGEASEGELGGGPQWARGGGERAPLSRQVSLASCNSLILPPRGSCSLHRWSHSLSRSATSPEQPPRSHLDDDGLAVHTDAVQQRLRQIEAGHQLEVETLKKQMQELWSRLKYQQHLSGPPRMNGDLGDELVRRRHTPEPPPRSSSPSVLVPADVHDGLGVPRGPQLFVPLQHRVLL